ncbi:MAG TPA: hypothetical protein VHW23_26940 [Kofleriaceae bacterium]|nr:hypothetical protein [Kofleriaceae bacterium]
MSEHPRYRLEDGKPCIDIRITTLERLFDNRDPAPFRERDLDPDLVEYLLAISQDMAAYRAFRIVFWLERTCQPGEIEDAYRAHFEYELERLERTRRRARRAGQIALALGAGLIVVLLSLSQLATQAFPGSLGAALHEGLLISSWVVLWKPVELLIYDWIPVWDERRTMRRLLAAPVEVRAGRGPDVAPVPERRIAAV